MKYLIMCLLLLSPLAFSDQTVGSLPNAAPGGPGDKGVEDDSCWKDSDGRRVKVDVRGTMHGDQDVTITEGDQSGSGKGTPASDDGCRESESIKVGSETYQVKDGKLKRQDGDKLKTMTQAKDDECADDETVPD